MFLLHLANSFLFFKAQLQNPSFGLGVQLNGKVLAYQVQGPGLIPSTIKTQTKIPPVSPRLPLYVNNIGWQRHASGFPLCKVTKMA
jgi:hypothetical protein